MSDFFLSFTRQHHPYVFLYALRRESVSFTRRTQLFCALPSAPCPAAVYRTRRAPTVIMETGVGADGAAPAARWALENMEPRLVVACGFAGALTPNLRVGDVLLASEV